MKINNQTAPELELLPKSLISLLIGQLTEEIKIPPSRTRMHKKYLCIL